MAGADPREVTLGGEPLAKQVVAGAPLLPLVVVQGVAGSPPMAVEVRAAGSPPALETVAGLLPLALVETETAGSAHRYHPCADSGGAKMNTRCPPKRVPSATRFFTLCRLTMQLPQSYSVGGQRSSGQLTGKSAGARPDYRGR
ncbi:UNVERIFIED_CONTAM: hypothetical protein FKN15_076283 [Acipenser sinensis]